MRREISWTNPKNVSLGMLYFIRIIDDSGKEYRYIGKSKRGISRLREYKNNIRRIFEGKPRRTTKGQEKYRPVHLALAKACEYGWEYEFYPLENVDIEELNSREKELISKLKCNLNINWSWSVENYQNLSMSDLP